MADTPQTLIGGVDTPASASGTTPGYRHVHLHHAGKRIRQFLSPEGKQVHIASSPDEATQLQKTLSASNEKNDFDLVIHGSPEHIDALRRTFSHHESRRNQLREENGSFATEFERVIREIDALSNELREISEHAVQLDANFSKYGYSAHLRTKDGPDESLHSSSDSTFDKETWKAERKLGETIRFFQRPIVRQYFHKGLLWRAKEAQEVASYELFIDLFYVGIISITGDAAAEKPTGESLLRFSITFILGWKFWSDIGMMISWFDADDVLRRCAVLFLLTCLLGFTTNMASAFETTYTPLVAFYIAARLFTLGYLFACAWMIPMVRGSLIGDGILMMIPAALWIASIHVEEHRTQALIWFAIVFDLFGHFLLVFLNRPGNFLNNILPAKIKESLEFFPGMNIEHRIERTNAFVTLVLGSCVLGLLYQSNVVMGVNAFFGKAVLGLIQAFVFNWIYFEIDSFNLHAHAIRRHVFSAMVWSSFHLPFIMSFVLSASALAILVRAHDCPNSPVDSLFETFISRSEGEVSDALKWYYCGGLGVALFSLAVISLSHTHRKIPYQRIRKESRLCFRVAVSIAIICLPKAHLNSLQLIATTTGLVVSVLMVDLVGMSCWGENLIWEKNCKRGQASYEARCGVKREELEKSVKDGTVLNVEEIARRGGSGGGANGFSTF